MAPDDPPIRLFSLSTCRHCNQVKRYFDECTIRYEFTDVDLLDGEEKEMILEDVRRWNPDCSYPTIIINDTVIIGFKIDEIKQALELV